MASAQNFLREMQNIDINDLPYVERDLNFTQKVSLFFLLFGDHYTNGAYILQKLLALARIQDVESGQKHSDLLREYAKTNPHLWRAHLIESLCIIRARRVLRKLGFRWQELRAHYLPHINEITLHIHPLLKALYAICEQLTERQSGRMVLDITDMVARRHGQAILGEPLRFYNFKYLEIFLLDWIGRRYLNLGDINAKGCNIELLIEYLKLNDMHSQVKMLIDTVNTNAQATPAAPKPVLKFETDATENSKQGLCVPEIASLPCSSTPTPALHLRVTPPGIALIINQQKFDENVDDSLKYLMPLKKLGSRRGTDADKERLKCVFSSLGYQVECHDNVDHINMISLIGQACARSLLPDSLIVCILSHGFQGAVYASNSIPLGIADIENVICANENLRDKPKFLIIQACQLEDKINNKTFEMKASTQSPVQHINMLLAMSTVQGFQAQRHTVEGSWFIQCLCDAIEEHASSKHIADILTIVIDKVSQKCGDKGQTMVPKTSGSLRQNVYFPKPLDKPQ